MVIINGKEEPKAEGKLLEDWLSEAGFSRERVAVERNGEIVPKSKYEETILRDGDVLEVVSFVGGG